MKRYLSGVFAVCAIAAAPQAFANHAQGMAAYDAGKYQVAAKTLEASAFKGDLRSMTVLASMHEQGKVIPKNVKAAGYFYRLAAYKGDANSLRKLQYLEATKQIESRAIDYSKIL